MAKFRRMLSPINSIKHIVQHTNTVIPTGTMLSLDVAVAVVAPASATTVEVLLSSVIKAIYIELWYVGADGVDISSSFHLTIEKLPSGHADMTFAQSQNLMAYDNKKNVFYSTQGVIGRYSDGVTSLPLHKAWVSIPKGKQRMGAGDKLVVNIASIGAGRACGMFIYKEYR